MSIWATQSIRSQVRAGQLDKEAGESREENASLREQVEALRSSAAAAAKVRCCISSSRLDTMQLACIGMSNATDLHAYLPKLRSCCCQLLQRLVPPDSGVLCGLLLD